MQATGGPNMPPMSGEAKEDDGSIHSLMSANSLDYRLPPSLSVATSRSTKVYKSQNQTYIAGSDRIEFTLSTGASYVDLKNSYLKFVVQMPVYTEVAGQKAVNPKMAPGCSYQQLLDRVHITHSSGVELSRLNSTSGVWGLIKKQNDKSAQQRESVDILAHQNNSARPSNLSVSNTTIAELITGSIPTNSTLLANDIGYDVEVSPWGRSFAVAIPLCDVSPLFDQENLAPSFLMAGLQVHIDMCTPQQFFVCGTTLDGLPSWETAQERVQGSWPSTLELKISTPEMYLECYHLTDSISRKLQQISSSSGLEWNFTEIFHTQVTTPEMSPGIQLTRAMSRANSVIAKVRCANFLENSVRDSFESQPWMPEATGTIPYLGSEAELTFRDGSVEMQLQLGSQFIPSRPLRDEVEEHMHSNLVTFAQFHRGQNSTMSRRTFAGFRLSANVGDSGFSFGVPGTSFSGMAAVSSLPLESSGTLAQSGAAISAQRTCVVNMNFTKAADSISRYGSRRIDLYVPHEKLATLFLDSVVVRS